jgi:hypothetical protein
MEDWQKVMEEVQERVWGRENALKRLKNEGKIPDGRTKLGRDKEGIAHFFSLGETCTQLAERFKSEGLEIDPRELQKWMWKYEEWLRVEKDGNAIKRPDIPKAEEREIFKFLKKQAAKHYASMNSLMPGQFDRSDIESQFGFVLAKACKKYQFFLSFAEFKKYVAASFGNAVKNMKRDGTKRIKREVNRKFQRDPFYYCTTPSQ